MDETLRRAAERAIGFIPEAEGLALYEAARGVAERGPLLEIGSYCGKSSIYLGAAARSTDGVVFSIDHHRGSEEHQPGEAYHDPRLVDPDSGLVDTLGEFRRTIQGAELVDTVIGIIGDSSRVAAHWRAPLALVFIDGSHSLEAATLDYEGWAPHVLPRGLLAIHDVFEDPAEGGRAPYEIYRRALGSHAFAEVGREDSLRVLRRTGDGL
jgi:MMP 1-O-methyltransferase